MQWAIILLSALPSFLIGGIFGFAMAMFIPKEHRVTIRENLHRIIIGFVVTIVWAILNIGSFYTGGEVSWYINGMMGVVVLFSFTTATFSPVDLFKKK